MGLKGDRRVIDTAHDFYLQEVASRGIAVMASGVATNGQKLAYVATLPAQGSNRGGSFLGILMDDIVSIDLSDRPANQQKNQIPRYGDWPASIMTDGWCWTDMIDLSDAPGTTLVPGAPAYLKASGYLGTHQPGGAGSGIVVGKWASTYGSDGYAKLIIDPVIF